MSERDTRRALDELGDFWESLDDEERAEAAETIARHLFRAWGVSPTEPAPTSQ